MKNYYLLFFLFALQFSNAQGPGKALDFDGVDDFVSIATPAGASVTSNFTFEAWVQPKDATKNMHIVSSRTPSECGFDIQILNGNKIHGDIGNGTAWRTTTADASYNYQVGVWFHLAYVVDNSGYSIYVNGNLLASGTYNLASGPVMLTDSTHQLQLGRYVSQNSYFRGALDDVRISLEPFTAAQVQASMNSSTPVGSTCFLNYTFSSGTANGNNSGLTTVANSVTSFYTGTMNNFSLQTSGLGNWTTDRLATNVSINDTYYTATLKDAFDLINSTTYLSGAIQVKILKNTNETAALSLNASNSGGINYTSISIKPSGNRSVTGNISNPMIVLNNADNVTFDGLNDGTNQLTIENTSTSNFATTMQFKDGASFDTVTKCNIYGSSSGASGSAVIDLSGFNEDYITITNCNVGTMSSNYPRTGISSSSATACLNINISDNNIFNIFTPDGTARAVYLANFHGVTMVTNNHFYQTVVPTVTGTSSYFAVDARSLADSSSTDLITGNTIGYANANGTGYFETYVTPNAQHVFRGINYRGDGGVNSSIQNNTISGIKVTGGNINTTPFIGIDAFTLGDVVKNNTIGAMDSTGAINYASSVAAASTLIGIRMQSGVTTIVSGNSVGGFTIAGAGDISFAGIDCAFGSVTGSGLDALNNIIGGTVANSINVSTGAAGVVEGLSGSSYSNVKNNTIRNMTSNAGRLYGINLLCRFGLIDFNKVSDLRNTGTGVTSVTGIKFSVVGSTGDQGNVRYNNVHTLLSDSDNASSLVIGIESSGGYQVSVNNNMIALGKGITKGVQIRGVFADAGGYNSVSNNSVYITGSPTTSNANTYALYDVQSNGVTIMNNLSNNILVNNRSNNGSAGTHFSASVNSQNLICDYNLYYGTGTGYVPIRHGTTVTSVNYPTLAAWKTATSKDFNSYASDPKYIDPEGTTPNLHISPTLPTLAEGKGTGSIAITIDYDNESRSGLTPADIGADAGNFTSFPNPVITSYSISTVCTDSQFVINGTGFYEASSVRIGAVPLNVVSYTPTAITVSSATAVTGSVLVTTPIGTASGPSLTIAAPPSITTNPITPAAVCEASGIRTITVVASNAAGYQWRKNGNPITADAVYSNVTTNTLTITNPPYSENGASYDVVLTGIGNCPQLTSNTAILTVSPAINVGVLASNPVICNSAASSVLTATGATSYAWSPATGLSATTGASVTANPSVTTTYTVTGTSGACTMTAQVTVSVTNPAVAVNTISVSICAGSSASLAASGATSYSWSPATGLSAVNTATVIASPSVTTTYTVTGTVAGGCTDTKTITVYVKKAYNINTTSSPALCTGQQVTLYGNKAMTFDGSDDRLDIGRNVADDFTMEFWMKTTQTGSGVFGTNWSSGRPLLDADVSGGSVNDFGVALMGNKVGFGIGGIIGVSYEQIIYSSSTVNTGQWVHIAVTRKKATGKCELYVNGNLEATQLAINQNTLNACPVIRVGGYLESGTYFNGSMDEVRIWNVVRSQQEIQENMNLEISPSATGLVDYLSFNHLSGAPVNSANILNNASPTGGPAYNNFYPNGSFSWSNGATTSEITVATAGDYTMQYTDGNGCVSTSAQLTIIVNPLPSLSVSPSTSICNGCNTTLTATGTGTVSWSPAYGLNTTIGNSVVASPQFTTTYTATLTAATGCISTQSVTVTVDQVPQTENTLHFDGDSYVEVAPIAATVSGSYTVEAWVKPQNTNAMHIFSTRNGNDNTFDLQISGGNTIHGDIGSGSGFINTSANASYTYVANRWMHIAYVVTPTSYKIYVNGIQQAANTLPGIDPLLLDANHFITIGKNQGESTLFLGTIDDVKVYKSALTPSQIQYDMLRTGPSDSANLVALYDFNQGTPGGTNTNETTLIDKYQGTYTGTLHNFSLTGNTGNWVDGALVTITAPTAAVCPGASVIMTAAGGSTYAWTPTTGLNTATGTSVTATISTATTYTATTLFGAMPATGQFTITQSVPTVFDITATPGTIAPGESTMLSVTNGTTVSWSPAYGLSATTGTSVIASPLFNTTYTATVTNANGCTSSKTIVINVTPAASDNALYFDGVDDFIQMPAHSSVTTNFTVEAWVMPMHATKTMHVMSTRNGSPSTNFDIQISGGNSIRCNIGWANGWVFNNAGGTYNYTVGQWMHIAYVVTQSGFKLYVNGNLIGSASSPSGQIPGLFRSNSYLVIGSNPGENTYFNGLIDDMKIYNVALSQAQVRVDMLPNSTADPLHLVCNYNFNNGIAGANNSGITTLADAYTTNYNGTLQNFALDGPTSNWVDGAKLKVTTSATAAVCQTEGVTFMASGAPSYSWSPATGLSSATAATVLAQPDVTTTYTVTALFGTVAYTKELTATITPAVPISINTSSPTVQNGEGAILTASGAESYSWSPALGLSATTGTTITATPQVTTTYTATGSHETGCPSAKSITIKAGATSLDFDGVDDYVNLPTGFTIAGAYTFEAWVKPAEATKTMHIVSTRNNADASFDIQIMNGNRIHADIGDGANWIVTNADATYNYTINTWFHLACVVTATSYEFYVNGTSIGSGTLSASSLFLDNAHRMHLGHSGNENTLFKGQLDDVRVWDRALSQCEIINDKDGELAPGQANLAINYKFNQGYTFDTNTGLSNAIDSSGNNHDATLTNFALSGNNSNWAGPGAFTAGTVVSFMPVTTPYAFCSSGTVADLIAMGVGLQWYLQPADGTPLVPQTPLLNNTTYYVSQTVNGCVSSRASLLVASVITTWNGSSWSNGYPGPGVSAAFTEDYTAVNDLSACSLTISNDADVVVNSGNDFIVSGMVTVDTGASLTFENNANLIQIEDIADSGNIMVKRYEDMRRLDYVYWGAPVAGQDLKLFSPQTVSPPVGASRFYTMNEATNSFSVIPEPTGVTFAEAKGYMLRAPNNFNPLPNAAPETFLGQFYGVPNNGTATIAITNTPGTGLGFNMLSNPYPSPISASLFLAQNPGALYFWTHTNQNAASGANYATYTNLGHVSAAGGEVPNGTIQTGQGFLLKTAASGTATFTNAMRTGNNAGQFFRTEDADRSRIWLNLSNSVGLQNQILVGYIAGATQDFDVSIDARQIEGGISNIASLINGAPYNIQGRALPFTDADEVPLSFNALTAGNYTIAIDHVDGLFAEDQPVFLKDNLIGTVHDIKASPYDFASAEGSFANRFEIVYQNATLGVAPILNPDSVILYKENGIFKINSGKTIIKDVKVFDVRGRLIYEQNDINATATTLTRLRAEQEVLLVQITSDQNEVITKKAVY